MKAVLVDSTGNSWRKRDSRTSEARVRRVPSQTLSVTPDGLHRGHETGSLTDDVLLYISFHVLIFISLDPVLYSLIAIRVTSSPSIFQVQLKTRHDDGRCPYKVAR